MILNIKYASRHYNTQSCTDLQVYIFILLFLDKKVTKLALETIYQKIDDLS